MFDDYESKEIEEIISLVEELKEFYEGDDWLVYKKYILRYSHPTTRKNFSTRHQKTKKHSLNKFEINLINFCKTNYNLEIKLYEKDRHLKVSENK